MASDSDEELLLAQKAPAKADMFQDTTKRSSKPVPGAMKDASDDDDNAESDDSSSESSSDDDVPLARRVPQAKTPVTPKKRPSERSGNRTPAKRARNSQAARVRSPTRRSATAKDDKEIKWTTLEHGGVLFPPEYTPHGVKMKYNGVPVDLTPEQEEVATMYAAMLETDYVTQPKQKFLENFWEEFKAVLGRHSPIKGLGKDSPIEELSKCDFRDIYNHLMAEREAKKALSKEEKQRLKAEKDAAEAKFKFAVVDGRKEPVGNFRVEPPGLFRGRGEHPKMGKLKSRIYPSDITINIGKGVPVPAHPYEGQRWKEVRHDRTVTWLAFWKDPIDPKGYKYVWLGANSTFKTESDLAKYEKARKLKDHIERIRRDYQRMWKSKDARERQMSTALYFIDILALRAGHDKEEDEADTVGCCTLKVENVEMLDDNKIKFDFLGKDSIRYENTVQVEGEAWANVKDFAKRDVNGNAKVGDDQLFDAMTATDLNNMMKDYMDGLSVKVFRTYNASITLDRLLYDPSASQAVVEKKADYDRANKEVAVLCNHQRAVPKTHEKSMQRMLDTIQKATDAYESLKKDLQLVEKGKPTQDGKNLSVETVQKRYENAKLRMDKLIVQKDSKEELKTVALGTSKINYLDPRITVSWCKRQDMPIEKIFNKSLLGKFIWAMDVEPEFKF